MSDSHLAGKIIFASEDFVKWLHKKLHYKNIYDTINIINSINKVFLGKIYLLWLNNKELTYEMYNLLSVNFPPGVTEANCKICQIAIKRGLYCENHFVLGLASELQDDTAVDNSIMHEDNTYLIFK